MFKNVAKVVKVAGAVIGMVVLGKDAWDGIGGLLKNKGVSDAVVDAVEDAAEAVTDMVEDVAENISEDDIA